MWFKVSQKDGTVETVGPNVGHTVEETAKILGPTAGSNGQHVQLPGHVIAEWDGEVIRLFHPGTEPTSGHVDIYYSPKRRDGKWGVDLNVYSHNAQITSLAPPGPHGGELENSWPTGGWDLITTIVAIEDHIEKTIGGYRPQMRRWVEHSFRPTMS